MRVFFIISRLFYEKWRGRQHFLFLHRHKQKTLQAERKGVRDRLSDHVGRFPVVMISPADSALIAGGSDERRKIHEQDISQYNPSYLDAVLNYNKALSKGTDC